MRKKKDKVPPAQVAEVGTEAGRLPVLAGVVRGGADPEAGSTNGPDGFKTDENGVIRDSRGRIVSGSSVIPGGGRPPESGSTAEFRAFARDTVFSEDTKKLMLLRVTSELCDPESSLPLTRYLADQGFGKAKITVDASGSFDFVGIATQVYLEEFGILKARALERADAARTVAALAAAERNAEPTDEGESDGTDETEG